MNVRSLSIDETDQAALNPTDRISQPPPVGDLGHRQCGYGFWTHTYTRPSHDVTALAEQASKASISLPHSFFVYERHELQNASPIFSHFFPRTIPILSFWHSGGAKRRFSESSETIVFSCVHVIENAFCQRDASRCFDSGWRIYVLATSKAGKGLGFILPPAPIFFFIFLI